MNISNDNEINILDLPDEILQFIFNKLNMVDMLYSLVDVNQRFDRLTLDSLFIHHLDLTIEPLKNSNCSMYTHILDRICEKILPRISQKVTKLTLESFPLERLLGTVDYPQLHSLSFVNFQPKILLRHLTEKTLLRLLTNQITHITIDITIETTEIQNENGSDLFEWILLHSRYLHDLTFLQNFSKYSTFPSLNLQSRNFLSSTLTTLRINVNTFDECLYLLNGCLQSLSTLIIRIFHIRHSLSTLANTKKLLGLKCFSLSTHWYASVYEKRVIPLLQRMLNLEELTLFLPVTRSKSNYIDGDQLYNEVLNYMPRIKRFIFSIQTQIMTEFTKKEIGVQSNADIRNSFTKRGIQSIDVCSDDKLINDLANCHVYSLPYQFNDFLFLNNCFQGGRFDKVQFLHMEDKRPFEHQLFQIISQSFLFLRKLSIFNEKAQKNKQCHSSILITFNHLFELRLLCAHLDYAIQFLSDQNTHLPRLTNLTIRYKTLTTVTKNFTNDATRLSCAQIKSLTTDEVLPSTQNFHSYFPSL